MLARVVCRSIGDPSQSRNRGYVDDRTLAGREHPRPERLAQQKWSGEVHVDDSAPLGSGRLLGWGDQGDAVLLHHLEALGQQAVGDVGHEVADLGEVGGAVEQDEQDRAGPALADELDGAVVERAAGGPRAVRGALGRRGLRPPSGGGGSSSPDLGASRFQ